MARKAKIARERRVERIIEKYSAKRAELLSVWNDASIPIEKRREARLAQDAASEFQKAAPAPAPSAYTLRVSHAEPSHPPRILHINIDCSVLTLLLMPVLNPFWDSAATWFSRWTQACSTSGRFDA